MRFLYILIAFLPSVVFSQKATIPKEVNDALNEYSKYMNVCVQALGAIQKEFQTANLAINRWADKATPTVVYSGPDPLADRGKYPQQPSALYDNCLNGSAILPANVRGDVNILLGKFRTTFDEMYKALKDIQSYIRNEKYKTDTQGEFAFSKLRRMEVLFFDIKILEVKINWELEEIRSGFEVSTGLLATADVALSEASAVIRACFKALYDERDGDLRNQYVNLPKVVKKLEIIKADLSEPLRGPWTEIIDQVKAAKAALDDYYSPTYKVPADYPYSKNFYFHNERLQPIFNTGSPKNFVDAQNTFKRQAGLLTQDGIGEAPIYKPLLPKFLQEEIEPLPDPEVFMKRLEEKRKREADSIAAAKAAPKVGDPTLEGFASNNLILLLDVSSSMNKPEKLPLLKKSIEYLLSLMRPEDYLSIVTYSGEAKVALPPTSSAKKDKILEVVKNLRSGGESDVNSGIKIAYGLADQNYIAGGNNRIILATDGKFELEGKAQRLIEKSLERSIFMSVFYFGDKEYEASKPVLEKLAADGGGRYSYIKAENAEQTLLIEAQSVKK